MNLRRRVFTAVAVFALLAAACGDDAESTTTAAAPVATTAAPVATTAAPPATTAGDTTPPDAGPVEPMEGQLAGLTVVDDLTFTVELKDADAEFPIQLNYAAYYALPEVFYDDPIGYEDTPIGNGAFMVDGVWDHDLQIRTVPFDGYQGPDPPQVDSLTFQIYESVDTAYLDLLAGNLDIVDSVPVDQIATAEDQNDGRYGETPSGSIYYYGFPEYLGDLYSEEIRAALSMSVDRKLVIDAVLNGTRTPAYSAWPPSIAGARENVCENWSFNPERAKEIWDSVGGWAQDEFIVWFNSGSNHDQIADAVITQWSEHLGLDRSIVKFEQLEFSEYLPLIDEQGLTGLFRLGWGQDYPSPLNFLEPLYASYNFAPTGSNSTFYDNPEFDDLLAQGKAAIAASGALADGIPFYQAAEEELCNDVTIMPIYFGKNIFVWSDNVTNVTVDAFSDINYTTIQGGDVSTYIVEPEHLNPLTSNESEGIAVMRALFAPLVAFDAFTGESSNMMAQSITSDDLGKTWTITLEPGWTFHNGEVVTASSYVRAWSFGADGANGQQNNSFYRNIEGYVES